MQSKRQQKVAKQIQKDLSDILQRDMKHLLEGAFVSISEVKISPDLAVTRIYLSFLNATNREIVLEKIQENTSAIRKLLGERVRHQLRIVPNLLFYIDDTADVTQQIDALFANIVIPPANEEIS